MKKALFATTALVAGAVLNYADVAKAADPIQVGVGGFWSETVGVAIDKDSGPGDNTQTVSMGADWELNFDGSTTLDNGLTFGVGYDIESPTDSSVNLRADDAFLYVSGGFGTIYLGTTDAATNGWGAHPTAGAGLYGVAGSSRTHLAIGGSSGVDWTPSGQGDQHKIRFDSPRLAGFRLMASYAPGSVTETSDDGVADSLNGDVANDEFTVALDYNNNFGGFSLKVGGSFGIADTPGGDAHVGASNPLVWNTGAQVGVAGFTVGGAYGQFYNPNGNKQENKLAWLVGAGYSTGPVSVGAGYGQATEGKDSDVVGDDSYTQHAVLAGAYTLGAGVTASAALQYASQTAFDVADYSGFSIATGLAVSF